MDCYTFTSEYPQLDKAIETYESAIIVSKKMKLGYEKGYQKEIERLK